MPVDKYRNQGPEDSADYHNYEIRKSLNFESDLDALIMKDSKRRVDSRSPEELRKIYLKTGVVGSIKGSAYAEVGNTKILVSVYEPREIPRLSRFCQNGELEVEFRFAMFSGRTRRNALMQNDEKDLSRLLKHTLEPAVCRSEFPNCQVDIYVLVLDNDGSCFPAAVNTAGIALADAGIPMFDTIAAVQLGKQNDHIFLDPTLNEEEFCSTFYENQTKEMGLLTISYMPTIGQYSCTSFQGCCTDQLINKYLDLLTDRCCEITKLSRNHLAQDVLKKCLEFAEEEKK